MRDECEHGQLRRSCEICELRAELNGMNREAEEQSRLIEKQTGEIARLRQRIESAPVVQCQKVCVAEGHATQTAVLKYTHERVPGGANSWIGKRVRLVIDDAIQEVKK